MLIGHVEPAEGNTPIRFLFEKSVMTVARIAAVKRFFQVSTLWQIQILSLQLNGARQTSADPKAT